MSPATPPRALVTGATAGIGHEYARQLAARGYALVLVARNQERLTSTAADLAGQFGVETEVVAADLADREQLAVVEARLAQSDLPVTLLVNNAGFGLKRRFGDNTVDDETAMLDVLVIAVMRLSHAALGAMSARGGGGIINVSSVAAYLPRGTYSAHKAWVNSFGRWAAAEYGPRGVLVQTMCPGFTKTEFHQRMDVKRGSGFLWLDVERLVRESLEDFDHGKTHSIPSKRYKAIVAITRAVPTALLQKFQSLGRR